MNIKKLIPELIFKAIRSSGPGGQHVNKTSSKVEVTFNVYQSIALSDSEKEQLKTKLKSKISSVGDFILSCDTTRSQHKNKAIVIERLIELLKEGLKEKKLRKKTKPSKSSIEKRLTEKKKIALKKENRKRPPTDN